MIALQARHMIERRPRLFENGVEGRKGVLRLTAKVGRKPSLGVGPDDAGDEDLVADPDGRRKLVSFGGRLHGGRHDGRERLLHWVSPGTDDGDHFSEIRSRLHANSDNDLADAPRSRWSTAATRSSRARRW